MEYFSPFVAAKKISWASGGLLSPLGAWGHVIGW